MYRPALSESYLQLKGVCRIITPCSGESRWGAHFPAADCRGVV